MSDIDSNFVHLARLTLEGKLEDAGLLARRTLIGMAKRRPDLAPGINSVLSLSKSAIGRDAATPVPIDVDSRLDLVRRESFPSLPTQPIWPKQVAIKLEAILQEREREEELIEAKLLPTRSILFVGPPGVGKTLAARWLASQLKRPLLTLDLAAVMSSFLGRTGNNIRVVLDYARSCPSVLLLDEFDAIAKRRDDTAEVGELKRLVTVLLQAIDEWPAQGLLIGATNHPELLDPAVWRRFDLIVQFPLPSHEDIVRLLSELLENASDQGSIGNLLAHLVAGHSFSEIVRLVTSAKRAAIVQRAPFSRAVEEAIETLVREAPMKTRLHVARSLQSQGASQREIATATGLSRDTLRKHLPLKETMRRMKGDAWR